MSAIATKMTLAEFGADQVWYASIGAPTGETVDLFFTDDETGERAEFTDPRDAENAIPDWWSLEGTTDGAGEWEWDGRGEPRDFGRNAVTLLKATRSSTT